MLLNRGACIDKADEVTYTLQYSDIRNHSVQSRYQSSRKHQNSERAHRLADELRPSANATYASMHLRVPDFLGEHVFRPS